ncbi:MAG TPA: hypothetical protein VI935_06985 [Thermodesulfobacteriota bacterium]|nr:hypothetical protein [Thermodesulfobacteriota bacterium]HZX13775.1 hypothetical protein [Thermodesulfobacteriota bacterium]
MGEETQTSPLYQCSIVILGSFNPGIFQPEWIERFGILPEQEVKAVIEPGATVTLSDGKTKAPAFIITPEITQILFPTFQLKVGLSRFEFLTLQRDEFERVPEVVIKIFHLLPHTPISAVGINFNIHLPIKDDVNEILKSYFQGKFFTEESSFSDGNNLLQILGESYEIWGTFRCKKEEDTVTVQVQPSLRIENGIYLDYNFHSDLQDKTAKELVDILTKNFLTDFEIARKIQYFISREESGL